MKCRVDNIDAIFKKIWRNGQSMALDAMVEAGNSDTILLDKKKSTSNHLSSHFRCIGSVETRVITNVYGS